MRAARDQSRRLHGGWETWRSATLLPIARGHGFVRGSRYAKPRRSAERAQQTCNEVTSEPPDRGGGSNHGQGIGRRLHRQAGDAEQFGLRAAPVAAEAGQGMVDRLLPVGMTPRVEQTLETPPVATTKGLSKAVAIWAGELSVARTAPAAAICSIKLSTPAGSSMAGSSRPAARAAATYGSRRVRSPGPLLKTTGAAHRLCQRRRTCTIHAAGRQRSA